MSTPDHDHYLEYARKELNKALEAVSDSNNINHNKIETMIQNVINEIDNMNNENETENKPTNTTNTNNVSNNDKHDSFNGIINGNDDGVFNYLGLHWLPVRKIKDKIESRKIDEFKHSTDYNERNGYSYDGFYDRTHSNADIFKCIETGKYYIPGNFTLYDVTNAIINE